MNLSVLLSIFFCIDATKSTNSLTVGEKSESLADTTENSIKCGGEYGEKLSILQSPQNVNKFAAKFDCVYLLKGPEVCPVYYTLEFVNFDLQDSVGCVKDRLEIDNQDALCGKEVQSRTYFAANGSLQLRYKSEGDDQSSKGFKILITRSECETEQSTIETVTTTQYENEFSPPPFVPNNLPTHIASSPHCCQNSYNSERFLLTSPYFPYSLNKNTECTFIIHKAARNICRIRLNFQFFWMGQNSQNNCPHGYLEVDGKYICGCNQQLKLITTFDTSNFKVLTFKSHGIYSTSQSGFVLEVIQDECPTKYHPGIIGSSVISKNFSNESDSYTDQFNRVDWPESLRKTSIQKLQLVDERTETSGYGDSYYRDRPRVVKTFYYFAEPDYNAFPIVQQDIERTTYIDTESINSVITSFDTYRCESWNQNQLSALFERYGQILQTCRQTQINEDNDNEERNDCVELNYLEGYFKSPGYPYHYPPNLNICYRFIKQPGYCAVRMMMIDFQLEYSRDCKKDFFSFDNHYRNCGTNLYGRTLTLDFNNKRHQDLSFVTDSSYSCRGFSGIYQQIICQSNFPLDPERPPTTSTPATAPPEPLCHRIIRDKYFQIEVSGNEQKCSFKIEKVSESICKINLYFEIFDLLCAVESVVVDGMMFCGHLSGRKVLLGFEENEFLKELNYKSTLISRNSNSKFRIIGEQVDDDCPYPLVPVQRLVQAPPQISSIGPKETGVMEKHQQFYIRLQDHEKEICGVISNDISDIQTKQLCEVLRQYPNTIQCAPLEEDFSYSPYRINRLKLKNNNSIQEVEYEEIKCSEISID